MITPQTIGNILRRDCKSFGIEEIYVVFEDDNGKSEDFPHINPDKGVENEMIIIHVKRQIPSKYWKNNFNEVNICVPRIQNYSNRIRLEELERQAMKILDDVVSSYDGTTYRYSIDSIGTEADTALKCHYVNARILFEVLNVK